jgi:HSP20 family protein
MRQPAWVPSRLSTSFSRATTSSPSLKVSKEDLDIQAKENTIRIAGRKSIKYKEGASVHRRERVSGEFDRTLTVPVEIDPDGIKAEYRDGVLELFIPTAEKVKPRSIKIT